MDIVQSYYSKLNHINQFIFIYTITFLSKMHYLNEIYEIFLNLNHLLELIEGNSKKKSNQFIVFSWLLKLISNRYQADWKIINFIQFTITF